MKKTNNAQKQTAKNVKNAKGAKSAQGEQGAKNCGRGNGNE